MLSVPHGELTVAEAGRLFATSQTSIANWISESAGVSSGRRREGSVRPPTI
jgi:hypothetical protein